MYRMTPDHKKDYVQTPRPIQVCLTVSRRANHMGTTTFLTLFVIGCLFKFKFHSLQKSSWRKCNTGKTPNTPPI